VGKKEDRKLVSTVLKIMSEDCAAQSHLSRIRIVEEAMCVCLRNYETVDHLIYKIEKCSFSSQLSNTK
jgi:hypothetical protein